MPRVIVFGMAAALLGAAMLGGCASEPTRLPLGVSKAEVLERLGQPTGVYPLAGGERLQYSREPGGSEVSNVDLDASGRVVSVRQEMEEGLFPSTIEVGTWTRADVLRTYGRPVEIAEVTSFNGTIWSWRYLHINNHRLLNIYIDPQGVVVRWHSSDDLRYEWVDI